MSTRDHSLVVLIVDWVFIAALTVLIFSGFYLHSPLFFGGIGKARYIHLVLSYVVLTILALKIYFRLLGLKSGLKTNFVTRAIYNSWFFILIFQALVTFSVYWAPLSFARVNSFFGGLSRMYVLHYFLMWILAGTLAIYIYVFFLEAVAGVHFETLGDFFEQTYRKRKT